jgi:regulator of protease activity HflC (stomatin/prohibitin superfamily)
MKKKPEAPSASSAGVPEEVKKYIAPRRQHIKDEVCQLLPQVPRELVRKLDYWALYTIHQDVVKSGADPETMARRLVKGYSPEKAKQAAAQVETRKARELEIAQKRIDAQRKKEEARAKADAAKVRAWAARDAARAKAQAAKDKARAAQR